jgi:hypothetical protein
LAVGASVSAAVGIVPGIGIGVGGYVGLLVDRFRLEASGYFWPAETAQAAQAPKFGGSVQLAAGGARGCYAVVAHPFELSPCAGLELGSMSASGSSNLPTVDQASAWWIAPTFDAVVALPLGRRWALALDLGALTPVQMTFVLKNKKGTNSVFTPTDPAARIALAVEARF